MAGYRWKEATGKITSPLCDLQACLPPSTFQTSIGVLNLAETWLFLLLMEPLLGKQPSRRCFVPSQLYQITEMVQSMSIDKRGLITVVTC